jgi:hypothetical protein
MAGTPRGILAQSRRQENPVIPARGSDLLKGIDSAAAAIFCLFNPVLATRVSLEVLFPLPLNSKGALHMVRIIRCGGLFLVLLALIVPTFAGDEKKEDPKKKDGDQKKEAKKINVDEPDKKGKIEPKEKEKPLVWGVVFDGKLTQLDANASKDFTVQLTSKVNEPNLDSQRTLARQQQQLAQYQVQLKRARNNNERQQAQRNINNVMSQLAQTQQKLFKVKEVKTDYKLRAADDMKVRLLYPAPEYDDKGNLKKFSDKDLKAMKGPGNLPGFTAELDALRTGQMVRIYVARPATPAKGVPTKAKKIDEVEDLGSQSRHEVVMVLILGEPQQK